VLGVAPAFLALPSRLPQQLMGPLQLLCQQPSLQLRFFVSGSMIDGKVLKVSLVQQVWSLLAPFGSLVHGSFSAQCEHIQCRRYDALRATARGQSALSGHGREWAGDGLPLLVQSRTHFVDDALSSRSPSTSHGASLAIEGHRRLQLDL
jgi:hypothetical protein